MVTARDKRNDTQSKLAPMREKYMADNLMRMY